MISQRRLSRGVERPADGEAVEAAYVIGKALTHSGKGLGQNNMFREPVPRSGSMARRRSINNNGQMRRTSSMVGSRRSSLVGSTADGSRKTVGTRLVRSERHEPRQRSTVKTYSLTMPRNSTMQEEEVQTVFDEFGGPQRTGVVYRSPSMPSKLRTTRTIKKYVPSDRGLIAVDVPVEEVRRDQARRHKSMTRSGSALLRSQARTSSLSGSRTNSFTASRSASLSSLHTNSLSGRSSSRSSSLTGSKPSLHPPKRYNSITSSSPINGSKSQPMSIPLEEEEEENLKVLPSDDRMGSLGVVRDNSFGGGATTTKTTTTTITTITTKSLGASEPSGRAKTIKIVEKQSPTTTTTATESPTPTRIISEVPEPKLSSNSSSPLISPSKSQPIFETLDPSKNRRGNKLEFYRGLDDDPDVILEDAREDRDDEVWDNELEKEIKQSLDSPRTSQSPEPVFPLSPMENLERHTSQDAPVENIINPLITGDLEERDPQRKESEDNELGIDYKLEEDGRDLSDHIEFSDNLQGTPLATAIFFADKIEEIPQLPASDVTSRQSGSPSQIHPNEHLEEVDGHSRDDRGSSVDGEEESNENAVKTLQSSVADLQLVDGSNSIQEKKLDEEVRRELEMMGHDSNTNSDETSDELFVDSREDILDDAYVSSQSVVSASQSQRNPKRGYSSKRQVDGRVTPIKSALKKSSSEYFDPEVYAETSPASQAYLSLTTAENTRLNAQLTGGDTIPRRNLRSVTRSGILRMGHSPLSSSRDPVTSRRTSNHVGIKVPEKKVSEGLSTRTRYYTLNKPGRSRQFQKNDPVSQAKSNSSLLYPKEPPKRRSSFEKFRNKNEGIGMSKLSLRGPPSDNYQQNYSDSQFDGNGLSAPASSNDSGASSALFSAGFKSRFQDSDSEDENMVSNGVNGGKPVKHSNGTTGNGNGFSLFKHRDNGESEGFGKKFGKFSMKYPDVANQDGYYSKDEAFIDEELAESARKFGKKLKKLFGRSK